MRINLTQDQANQLQFANKEKLLLLAYNISHASSLSDNAFAFLIKLMSQESMQTQEVDFYFQEFHGDGSVENYNNYVSAWKELTHNNLIYVNDRMITFTGNVRFVFTCNAPEIKQEPTYYSNPPSQSWGSIWANGPFVLNQDDEWVLSPEYDDQFHI